MLVGPVSRPTVLVLGAGASMPYGFPSGEGLLKQARILPAEQLANTIRPYTRSLVPLLESAVHGTLDRSLDAMLELRTDLVEVGKAFMARVLLECEFQHRSSRQDGNGAWYRGLWDAFDLRTLESFRATPLTLITYNYDRSLEYSLMRSLRERFQATNEECAQALDCVGPLHLHGRLGHLPGFELSSGPDVVGYGGGQGGISDSDCAAAARNIRIVHEPNPMDEAFMRARDAIASAERVAFLGFGYARRNIERLLLKDCLRKDTSLYLCTRGFSRQQVRSLIAPQFSDWSFAGLDEDNRDIAEFLSAYPQLLT